VRPFTDLLSVEQEAKTGQNPAVKHFAAQTLPTLREHLKLALQIRGTGNQSNGLSK
jgi:hypothetical protein